MQLQAGSPPGDSDLGQIEQLCDDIQERAVVARREQAMLDELVAVHEQRRSHRAHHYQVLLEGARARYNRLCAAIERFCR